MEYKVVYNIYIYNSLNVKPSHYGNYGELMGSNLPWSIRNSLYSKLKKDR